MEEKRPFPYIPNSNARIKNMMLESLGKKDMESLYSFIPDDILLGRSLNLPAPITSEMDLKDYISNILDKNKTCKNNLCFLGAGCYDHYVPAICDEINSRAEFVTTYSNDTYRDHGKNQIFFEYASLMGELLNMDVVCFPVYDGGQAACTSVMMTKRITGRSIVLVPHNVSPMLMEQMRTYCTNVRFVSVDLLENGQVDLDDLNKKLTEDVSCVFIQNPTFLGFFEEESEEIGTLAHKYGAKFVVYADPASLGIISAPADYGADIACGDIQPLGIHMCYGGGLGGYIASRQEHELIMNYPGHLHGIFKNSKGEFGFTRTLQERTTYHSRERAVEFVGTYVGLWAITAAVYLSVMGPEGMRELGELTLRNLDYAQHKFGELPGVVLPFSDSLGFQEFVVNFDHTGKTVKEINIALLQRNIFGGFDLSTVMPHLGQSMLVCVTEKRKLEDIDLLISELRRILE